MGRVTAQKLHLEGMDLLAGKDTHVEVKSGHRISCCLEGSPCWKYLITLQILFSGLENGSGACGSYIGYWDIETGVVSRLNGRSIGWSTEEINFQFQKCIKISLNYKISLFKIPLSFRKK